MRAALRDELVKKTSRLENAGKREYYVIYSLLFFVTAFFCFSWYIFSGESLMWWADGWDQHYKALVYYATYLRKIFLGVLSEHRLIVPEWDFYIGEGSDVVNTLHYYVVGDPIAFLSVFVPTKYMQYFFSFSCVLRMYLSGISFSVLCFGTRQRNRYGVMAGALAYSFAAWGLCSVRHPYFINPMIYFPLMILGMEKIIRREKPYLFIAATAISAISNFYFFYMIVLLSIVYALVRMIVLYKKHVKLILTMLVRIGVMAAIGVSMAGILFVPVLSMFFQDSRLSTADQPFHLFYPLSYYSKLPGAAISTVSEYWLTMGFAVPALLAVFLLFTKKKENILLKVLFCISGIIMLFPIFGRILNGMSYMTNRWSWSLALLCAYTLVKEWDALHELSHKEWKVMISCCTAYYGICLLFDHSRDIAVFAAIPLLFLTLLIMGREGVHRQERAFRQIGVLFIVMLSAVNVAFWQYTPGENKENRKIWEEWDSNEAAAVKERSDSSLPLVRMSGRPLTANANIFQKISSTQYYWSLSNPYMSRYRSELAMREPKCYLYQGYDDRTSLLTLSGVQYYVVRDGDNENLPFGYSMAAEYVSTAGSVVERKAEELKRELGVEELSEEQREKLNILASHYSVYKNDYALPLGYCYDTCFSKEVWESYNPVQKQEIQMKSVYVDADIEGIELWHTEEPDYQVVYDTECEGMEITQVEEGFVTTADDVSIRIKLPGGGIRDSEVYVGIEGLEFIPTPEYDLYHGEETVDPKNLYNEVNWEILSVKEQISMRKEKIYEEAEKNPSIIVKLSSGAEKEIMYLQPDTMFSSGRHDFIVNLGYAEEAVDTITITFPQKGRYIFDSLRVYSVPMKDYGKKALQLAENTLQNIQLGTDTISGTIALDDKKILCMAIPFSAGWSACIDEQETEIYCLNDRYLGIVIPEGEHTIAFAYRMPGKYAGYAFTFAGIAAFALTVVIYERRSKKL